MNKIILLLIMVAGCITAYGQDTVKVICRTKIFYFDTLYKNTFDTTKIIDGITRKHDKVPINDPKFPYPQFYKWYTHKDTAWHYEIDTLPVFDGVVLKDSTGVGWCDSIIPKIKPIPIDSCEQANNNYEIKTTTNEEIIIDAVADYSRHYGIKPKRFTV